MSDEPLFQKTDEQERVYAPQELPEGSAAEHKAEVEEGARDSAVPEGGIVSPAVAAGPAAGGVATAYPGGTEGIAPEVTDDEIPMEMEDEESSGAHPE